MVPSRIVAETIVGTGGAEPVRTTINVSEAAAPDAFVPWTVMTLVPLASGQENDQDTAAAICPPKWPY